jgi:hypothetical protein
VRFGLYLLLGGEDLGQSQIHPPQPGGTQPQHVASTQSVTKATSHDHSPVGSEVTKSFRERPIRPINV